jgi:hypothetical protein
MRGIGGISVAMSSNWRDEILEIFCFQRRIPRRKRSIPLRYKQDREEQRLGNIFVLNDMKSQRRGNGGCQAHTKPQGLISSGRLLGMGHCLALKVKY